MFENLNFWQFVVLYLVLQVVYVILNTVTNIAKIKCSKLIASFTSAICYGFYVIVVVATASNQPIWVKMLLTAVTNIIGVYCGMLVMEKLRKDKLWKIEATVKSAYMYDLSAQLEKENISHNSIILDDGKEAVFNIYSKTQKESEKIRKMLNDVSAKYIIHESSLHL